MTIVAHILVRAGLRRIGLPGLLGYIVLGLLLHIADRQWNILGESGATVYEFMASVGLMTLLFRIGLESNLGGLIRQLPRAGPIWFFNVLISGAAGYAAARWVLGQTLIPSLFIAIALTATSVGVSVAVWREQKQLKSKEGELLIDVAELDDITGVALMVLLFSMVPAMHDARGDSTSAIWIALLKNAGRFAFKLALFVTACMAFSRYAEQRVTHFFRRIGHGYVVTLLVAATGFIIAAIAGWMGFSLAIGALFAGLVFSRDPESVKIDTGFEAIYDLFAPFFFVGIGMKIDPSSGWSASLSAGAVLIVIAVLGKMIGTSSPTLFFTGQYGALLLGLSMVPRAEIAMIIMQRGLALGPWAVSSELYTAMVLVVAVTCTATPVLLSALLKRYSPSGKS